MVLLFLFTQSTYGQIYYPQRRVDMDTATYNNWIKVLKQSHEEDSVKANEMSKMNVFSSYYNLKEPNDTLLKYLCKVIDFYPAYSYYRIYTDPRFPFIRKKDMLDSLQWEVVRHKFDSLVAKLDSLLEKEVVTMENDDQRYRSKMDNGGGDKELWSKQALLDSINCIKIDSIMNKYQTYPGEDLVGYLNKNAFFLILQHSPLPMQEKYLPLLRDAAQKKQMKKSNLCYITDRINMSKNKPQIYGTQFIWNEAKKRNELYIVEDLENIDVKRKDMGLRKLSLYMKDNNIEFPDGE
jgi:hypothetical protein